MADTTGEDLTRIEVVGGLQAPVVPLVPTRTAVLLDPHPLWLCAVRDVLALGNIPVVGEASAPEEALELALRHRPSILIAEITPSKGIVDGLSSLREAHRQLPELTIVVLSTDSGSNRIDAAFEAGANAYVLKTCCADDIATAIRQAFRRSLYFPPELAAAGVVTLAAAGEVGLTARERQILALTARGHSNAQLARIFWVTEQTVKFHLSNVYRKLGVSNRTEASRWAQVHGLLAERSASGGLEGDATAS